MNHPTPRPRGPRRPLPPPEYVKPTPEALARLAETLIRMGEEAEMERAERVEREAA